MDHSLRGSTVLVVDDDPLVRAMARDMFSGLGCTVLDAYNGTDALAMVWKHPEISLVFSDIRMPGDINGVTLAKLLHQIKPSLRVVLTSGTPPNGIGAFTFLPKPWAENQLAGLLDQLGAATSDEPNTRPALR